ncbi:MAG: hypothetical protein JWR77_963 [Rhizorhabdus sp.]|nr:hypothetical protein [Rhizorhabdus sp.]
MSGMSFATGWRPFAGWMCAAGLGFQFVIAPLLGWGGAMAGHPEAMPALDLSSLLTMLSAMLGLGGLRTVEKLGGVAAK